MDKSVVAKIEALLFTADEPISLEELVNVLEISRREIKQYIAQLKEEYQKDIHGIILKEYDECYLLLTKKEYSPWIEELHRRDQKLNLSQAALETLAIVAYKQPVTRSEIEEIRGVKAEKTLLTLNKYGLIQELGRKESIGNPIVYGTTELFLRMFDLEDLSQLPEPVLDDEAGEAVDEESIIDKNIS